MTFYMANGYIPVTTSEILKGFQGNENKGDEEMILKGVALPPLENDGQDTGNPPAMPFWDMSIAPDGRSTVEQRWLDAFYLRKVSGEATAIWMRQFPGAVKAVWFNILPVGWVGEWHPSPALQWVVPISGRWFIEAQSGVRVEMGPGDIHWGADIIAGKVHGQVGHRSGQLGDVPCVQLMVQFESTTERDVAAS